MFLTFFFFAIIYQQNDTLYFKTNDIITDTIILNSTNQDSVLFRKTQSVKISAEKNTCILFWELTNRQSDEVTSFIEVYDSDKELLWHDSTSNGRRFSLRLSELFDDLYIITETALDGKTPVLYTVRNGHKEVIIEEGAWTIITSYAVSPNGQYLILHTRHPFSRKLWDYIYFVDLLSRIDWQYLFPICLSCKRTKIHLLIDDTGQSEVVYKAEHRVFSKEGKLIDIYLKH